MSLFDSLKEKAAELLGGAGDKVSELTGIELPGGALADQLAQTAGGVETGQTFPDVGVGAVQDVTETITATGDTASATVSDALDPRDHR